MGDGMSDGLVGRDAELLLLGRFLTTIEQAPAAFLLEGPGGIGKSTLWQAAIVEARRRGIRVLAARPSGAEASWAYQSLADLFAEIEPGVFASLPGPQRRALEVALLAADPPAERSAEVEAAHAQAIAAGSASALVAMSRTSPVLIAVDDAPWMDAASSQVLASALRRLGHRPIGVLVTQRTERASPAPLGLDEVVPTERAPLEPFSLGALHLLLLHRLNLTLPRPTLARVHAMAHGNPLHAVELGRALQRLPSLPRPGEPLPVPESLRALLEARLAAVSDETRTVLVVAAAAGAPTVEELRRVVGDDADRALDEATDAGLLAVDAGVVRFTHPSLAAAAYETATPERRRHVHGALAETATTTEARARHRALSTIRPDATVATELEHAASDARRRTAMDTAAELIRLAVERTPAADSVDRHRRLLALAGLLVELPDLPAAQRVLDGLIPELPAGPSRAEARLLAGTVAWYTEADSRFATERLLAALPDAEGDAELVGRLHYRLAIFHDYDLASASRHAAMAVEALRAGSAPITLAGALLTLFHLTVVSGGAPRGEVLEEALALEGEGTHPDMSTIPGIWWSALDEPERARARFQLMLDRSRAAGETSGEADLLTRLAETAIVADRYEEAVRLADEALTAAQQEGQATPDPALRIRALAMAHLGLLDAAGATAASGAERARAANSAIIEAAYRQTLVTVEVARGRPDEVERHGARSADLLAAAGWIQPLRLDVTHERVEALVALGRLDEAERLLQLFEAGARLVPRPWAEAAIARGRARLLEARGQLSEAIATTDPATDERADAWRRFDRARTLLVRGELLRQHLARREAGVVLDDAAQRFEEIGAQAWVARARAEADRLGRRRSRSGALTATERRVAALAADGLRNREVAETLGITSKTVEAHLARIYAKLGIRSRAELGRTYSPDAS